MSEQALATPWGKRSNHCTTRGQALQVAPDRRGIRARASDIAIGANQPDPARVQRRPYQWIQQLRMLLDELRDGRALLGEQCETGRGAGPDRWLARNGCDARSGLGT